MNAERVIRKNEKTDGQNWQDVQQESSTNGIKYSHILPNSQLTTLKFKHQVTQI